MTRDLIIDLSKEVTTQTVAVGKANIVQLKDFYLGPIETGPTIGGTKILEVEELAKHPVMKEFIDAKFKGNLEKLREK